MQSLFSSAMKEIDPPPFHSSLRTKSGNSVYIDETTNRMYKFDHQTGKTKWISDDEEVSSDL
jgi:glucose dehydrogenase